MKVALCHGTFDVLHLGHVKMFAEARSLVGPEGRVIVTLTADRFVAKGPGRPIFNSSERKEMIEAVRYVDLADVIEEKTGLAAIQKYRPRFYVKGKDYLTADKHGALEMEREAVERVGGVLYLAEHAGYSSTAIIERIRNVSG